SRYDEAAMLGYAQSHSLKRWQEEVRRAIDQNGSELRLKLPQCDVKIICDFPLEWVSEHDRDTVNRPIIIYHILLDCCC
ncbi:MAG: hypothetical protein O7E52_21785, partial [Candidatus Poribacteria bacterium]|nr:hypothetical protein [Candidatus Poribacteria bacterium]